VEGLLPITAIEEAADARCAYRERDHAIVAVAGGDSGRNRRSARRKSTLRLTWKLGDRIRVRAERIDPIRRRVEFALASS
jgi:hypothetical protein